MAAKRAREAASYDGDYDRNCIELGEDGDLWFYLYADSGPSSVVVAGDAGHGLDVDERRRGHAGRQRRDQPPLASASALAHDGNRWLRNQRWPNGSWNTATRPAGGLSSGPRSRVTPCCCTLAAAASQSATVR